MRTFDANLWRLTGAGVCAACLLSSNPARATDHEWRNTGTLTTPPVIDATNFINEGSLNIFTTQPFETFNTLNYTNTGTMTGTVGFRLQTTPSPLGVRRPAASIVNQLGASISGGLYTLLSATNLINRGLLGVSANGEIDVSGKHLDISRGGLGVNPIVPQGSYNGQPSPSNFVPDIAVYDNYWGAGSNTFNSGNIINYFGPLLYVISPPHAVTAGGGNFNWQIGLQDPVWAAYTNTSGIRNLTVTNEDGSTLDVQVASNEVRQAVFVGISDPTNFSTSIRFSPSSVATNPMQTVAIEFSTLATNYITATPEFNTLYFVDTLASETNRGLLLNADYGTQRPANYLVSRAPVFEYFFGGPGNAEITNNFLYDPSFTNRNVTGDYAGYSAFVDNLTYTPPPVQGGTYTNLLGRVDIRAGSLDMNRARIRGEGYVRINTDHLISSAGAVVDCANLSYNLASTNGTLRVQNLVKESVARMNGDIYAWSSVWTNSMTQTLTNYSIDPDTQEATLEPLTYVVNLRIHCLILDGTGLQPLVPVIVHDMNLRAANNVIIEDSGNVEGSFSVSNSAAFTLNGALNFYEGFGANGTTVDWTAQNAPSLRHFTNNGSLSLPNTAHFGDDLPLPYLNFINTGVIQSFGQTIAAVNCELRGTNFTDSSFNMNAEAAQLISTRISAGGDIVLQADSLKLQRSSLESGATGAGGRITLRATNLLADAGASSSNSLTCYHGFDLPLKPQSGDLLGTAISTVSPDFALVTHSWAGADRMATKEGYQDNTALGFLRLIPSSPRSDFAFQGVGPAGTTNGLYVDVLDLRQLTDYQDRLFIEPNLVLYFAASLGVPAEELDGQLDGRLRWVSEYAGPNSSVEVVINGNQTVRYNRALRFSATIDSDGDGIPNGLDDTPFDGPVLALTFSAAPSGVALSWKASPQTAYRVESRGAGFEAGWNALGWTTNTTATTRTLTFIDTNATSARYYRVVYDPNGF